MSKLPTCTDCRNNIFTSLLRRLVQSVGQIQSETQVVKNKSRKSSVNKENIAYCRQI